MPVELVLQNFIDGQFVGTENHIDSYNPSTGEVYAKVPDSGEAEVNAAVHAAKEAFPGWSETPAAERSRIMNRIADLIESHLEEFAQAESRDQGKPVSLARTVDIPRAVYNFRFFATTILHTTDSSTYLDNMQATNYTIRTPLGVAGLISPWNLPLYLLTWKIAPAIACGNTVVCKPSEMTSVTAWMMCRLLNDAGLPQGVVNVVFGYGPKAGEAIVKHPDVPLVSFTGSTLVGQRITEQSAPQCKKLSLELGGKNPCIIFADADMEKCIPTVVRSSFANQGEVCLCSSRIFVQRSVYEQFLQKFVDATRKIQVGNPGDPMTTMGALISKEHLNKVKGYVNLAYEEGATILCGEGKEDLKLSDDLKNGYYMLPTVITDVKDSSRCMQEEIFGPVTCVVPFDTEDEVIIRANNVKYGLSASLWTQDVSRTMRMSRKLEAGTIWTNCWMVRDLNMPFGGMKSSGVGREGLKDSVDFFTEEKTVCIKH
ncbi:PREDICTED: aldehyde dehydrogenase family 8 member A1-like [Branchiostoma belcheri]|uniref:2-aminomuconic semialdehyde dehydrogenase n=1 Tax=Branchiostoma belcheri TaxID=7741 RepID=A0A6P4ZP54_BRABE|nr:PREDICTED: aldehyde dehydrogenase family 8 member A1-like [Branchiostoma belcheri]XP_019632802.1 PREDICTED: aldehyde dehydrogenase family 8 member A1-like [Branchiostoma belcheri]